MAARILVVDDSEVNRLLEKANLVANGYDVDTAPDGDAALVKLGIDAQEKVCDFDGVILDIMMPGIDGFEVLCTIRKKWNSVQLPVIMATAKDQPDDVVEALLLGANDYVTKPTNPEILLARLGVHLAMKENHEALCKAQEALVSAAKMESIGLLAAGMAHEIRNPLGRIQMATGGLKAIEPEVGEENREMLQMIIETIGTSVEKADEIVRNLMSVSTDQQLPLIESNLNQDVRDALETLTASIDQTKTTVITEFDESISPVLISTVEFRRALVAIIENAIQAMSIQNDTPGFLTLRTSQITMEGQGSSQGDRIGKRLRDGDSVVALYVDDTGPGMDQSIRDSAFDAFVTTKATGSGTGLGLTVARKVIELHHGVIRLEPRDDVQSGLRVSIFLKAIKKTDPA